MLEKLKRRLRSIDDEKLYSPQEIIKRRLITNTKLEPSVFTFYRVIKSGKIKVVNMGNGGAPRYFVRGKDLKEYITKRHNVSIEEVL